MTKNKQKDNPKFSFLFGGEYFNYYQYKVTTEQASKSQSSRSAQTAIKFQHSIFACISQSIPPTKKSEYTFSLENSLPEISSPLLYPKKPTPSPVILKIPATLHEDQ